MIGGEGKDIFQIHFNQDAQSYMQIGVRDFLRIQQDRIFISEMDDNGNFIRRNSEVKDALDTNNDRRIDATDGIFNGFGVSYDGEDLHLSIGYNQVLVINQTASLDFFV